MRKSLKGQPEKNSVPETQLLPFKGRRPNSVPKHCSLKDKDSVSVSGRCKQVDTSKGIKVK